MASRSSSDNCEQVSCCVPNFLCDFQVNIALFVRDVPNEDGALGTLTHHFAVFRKPEKTTMKKLKRTGVSVLLRKFAVTVLSEQN